MKWLKFIGWIFAPYMMVLFTLKRSWRLRKTKQKIESIVQTDKDKNFAENLQVSNLEISTDQKNKYQHPLDRLERFFRFEFRDFPNKSLKYRTIRGVVFSIFLTFPFHDLVLENGYFKFNPNFAPTIITLVLSAFMLLSLTSGAKSSFDFLVCFIAIYLLVFLRMDMVGKIDELSILYIFIGGTIIYLGVLQMDLLYRNQLELSQKETPEDTDKLKDLFNKSYERIQSNFDHAGNALAVLAATSLVLIKVNIISSGSLLTDSFVLAATYVAIIKYCTSIMKRNVSKFKDG